MKVKIKASGEGGFALLSVLVIIAIITPLVVNQSYKTGVQLTGSGYLADKIKSREIAKSGLEAAILALKKDDKDYDSYLDEWGQFVELSGLSSTFFEEGSFSGTIIDEEGKLNINLLAPNNEKSDQLTLLFDELQIDTDILAGVMDWIDNDSDATLMGAEDHYYKSLENRYNCKDGLMDNIYELRLIKGMTDEAFLGKGEAKGLTDFISVYGDKSVNINTAPYEVILSLSEDITPVLAREIIAYRETGPIKSVPEIKDIIDDDDLYDGLKSKIKVNSRFFSIRVRGMVKDIYTDLHAFIERNGDNITMLYYGEA
ncbi:MAG: type II secretion system minor pseudopilin GspK [bacterium]|nr:type II secretion system minor pseudopilin GspK [bacterium]